MQQRLERKKKRIVDLIKRDVGGEEGRVRHGGRPHDTDSNHATTARITAAQDTDSHIPLE